jgi:uncharacterized repeat protein (TIGR03847 family)
VSDDYDLGDVDAFTTGAVGEPGRRVFYLQVRLGRRHLSFKCEKQQVARLGEYLHRLLADLAAPQDAPLPGTSELNVPVEPEWIVGPIGVAYDSDLDRFVVVLEEAVPVDEEGNPDPELEESKGTARLLVTRGQASVFSARANEVVAAGRPTCRFCGLPMDPDGHHCPRMN